MLSGMNRLSRRYTRDRKASGLSQAQAADKAECHPSFLALVETGRRSLSRRMAERLERALGKKPGRYTRHVVPSRGRPRQSSSSAEAVRKVRDATPFLKQSGLPKFYNPGFEPSHKQSEVTGQVENILWPMGVHLGRSAQEEVEALEAQWAGQDHAWSLVNQLPFDSWSEKRMFVRAALRKGEIVRVAPRRLGCHTWLAHPRTGEEVAHRAQTALVLEQDGITAFFFPQQTTLTASDRFLRADFLVVASNGQRRVTAVVEVDGRDSHKDPYRDFDWELRINLPVLRLSADAVGRHGDVEAIYQFLDGLLTAEDDTPEWQRRLLGLL